MGDFILRAACTAIASFPFLLLLEWWGYRRGFADSVASGGLAAAGRGVGASHRPTFEQLPERC